MSDFWESATVIAGADPSAVVALARAWNGQSADVDGCGFAVAAALPGNEQWRGAAKSRCADKANQVASTVSGLAGALGAGAVALSCYAADLAVARSEARRAMELRRKAHQADMTARSSTGTAHNAAAATARATLTTAEQLARRAIARLDRAAVTLRSRLITAARMMTPADPVSSFFAGLAGEGLNTLAGLATLTVAAISPEKKHRDAWLNSWEALGNLAIKSHLNPGATAVELGSSLLHIDEISDGWRTGDTDKVSHGVGAAVFNVATLGMGAAKGGGLATVSEGAAEAAVPVVAEVVTEEAVTHPQLLLPPASPPYQQLLLPAGVERVYDTPGRLLRHVSHHARNPQLVDGKYLTTIGSASEDVIYTAGKAWVGPEFRVKQNGYQFLAGDKLRRFRAPELKKFGGVVQANFESGVPVKKRWPINIHVNQMTEPAESLTPGPLLLPAARDEIIPPITP
jgi:hypothetical protein